MSMSSNAKSPCENIFSSLISNIKSYNGSDPLLPWLRGIRTMKETLPPQLLKEKLPRFLQKCVEAFITDRRYSNDLRYLRVWLQLMDFVDEPRSVLKTMETNRIGIKKSLFYQAYALYYEKMKKFDAAEKIYHLGVQNLAEPADELKKSYEQFLQRLERHKNKRVQQQGGKTNKGRLNSDEVRSCKENSLKTDGQPADMLCKDRFPETEAKRANIGNKIVSQENVEQDENKKHCSDDTVVVRFVHTAIDGKSNTEDARHHGLVEPTIHTKEAMNAINSMFREPIEPAISGRTRRNQSSIGSSMNNGFEVFTDESVEPQQTSSGAPSLAQLKITDTNQPLDESFEIYVDGEETVDFNDKINGKGIPAPDTNYVTVSSNHATVFARPNDLPSECFKGPNPRRPIQAGFREDTVVSSNHATVFARPNDLPSECFKDPNPRRPIQAGFREDTVVYRFVGSTIADEPEVENVWHHGLVDPTINLKEAMKDINSMFGKPIEFTRKSRPKKHNKEPDVKDQGGGFCILADDEPDDSKANATSGIYQEPLNMALKCRPDDGKDVPDMMNEHSGFLILPDDELDNQEESLLPSSSTRNGNDLFEKTVCTKEAMDEINKLFSMPMDF